MRFMCVTAAILAVLLQACHFQIEAPTDIKRPEDPPICTCTGKDDQIKLIHQGIEISGNITLAWGVFDKVDDMNISPDNSSYVIAISDCDTTNILHSFITNTTNILIPPQVVNESYINISLLNSDVTINNLLRFQHGVMTMKEIVFESTDVRMCIKVPDPQLGPFAVLPFAPESNEADIFCLVVPFVALRGCTPLVTKTKCGGRINNSIYGESIMICNTTGQLNLCFSNMTRRMNGTKLHLLYSISPRCAATGRRQSSNIYNAAYWIIVREPVIEISSSKSNSRSDHSVPIMESFVRANSSVTVMVTNGHYNNHEEPLSKDKLIVVAVVCTVVIVILITILVMICVAAMIKYGCLAKRQPINLERNEAYESVRPTARKYKFTIKTNPAYESTTHFQPNSTPLIYINTNQTNTHQS